MTSASTQTTYAPIPTKREYKKPIGRALHDPELDAIEEQLLMIAANINASQSHWIDLLFEFDRRGGWMVSGVANLAQWLSWRVGITPGAAREKVRVCRAIQDLPAIHAAFKRGELSYSKVRAMTRVATPSNEETLVYLSKHSTAQQLDKAISAYSRHKLSLGEQSKAAFASRGLTWSYDEPDNITIRARLTREQGNVVLAALRELTTALEPQIQQASQQESDQESGDAVKSVEKEHTETIDQRRADALERMAALFLAQHDKHRQNDDLIDAPSDQGKSVPRMFSGGDRYLTNIDVDFDTLLGAAADDDAEVSSQQQQLQHDLQCLLDKEDVKVQEPGSPAAPVTVPSSDSDSHNHASRNREDVAAATLYRIGCDTSFVAHVKNNLGETLSVGRKTRTIPPAIRRALVRRDAGCTFPGCSHKQFVDAHHIQHWAHGGETSLDNLVLLCDRHHRLVHEGGFTIKRARSPRDDHGHNNSHNYTCECIYECIFEFITPSGHVYTGVTPTRTATQTVPGMNTRNGMLPKPDAPVSKWMGDRMDYSLVVGALMRADAGS